MNKFIFFYNLFICIYIIKGKIKKIRYLIYKNIIFIPLLLYFLRKNQYFSKRHKNKIILPLNFL